jgi:hypothetical protein
MYEYNQQTEPILWDEMWYIFLLYFTCRLLYLVYSLFPQRENKLEKRSRKVAGSIPDKVTGFFNLPNLSNRNMVLGSTQPLTEMSTRNLPGGKGRPVGT